MPHNTPTDEDSTPDHATTDSESASTTNYYRLDPPTDCGPPEYSYVQRRAEILDFVVAAGGPAGVENTRLADRYDVNRSTIKRDLDALSEYIGTMLGDGEDMMFRTLAIHDRVVADLLSEDDWRAKKAAYDLHRDFVDWVGVQPGTDSADPGETVDKTAIGCGEGEHGFLTPRNRAHFDRIEAAAEEATAPNTVSTDNWGDERETDKQDTATDSTGE